ncbi:hypothetical protein [Algoriphagus sp. A40]|uniref:RipA family octameric membrane protein n=1 Tax=Algoriphagus sp. A40 TaxID=1945863 RepID=UPI00098620C5|nr:hypothetical protein [Algoriphagus sp. A40]OOG69554.1 hypothetical protein B0E43_21430 [Algoriphagus sp. A40]
MKKGKNYDRAITLIQHQVQLFWLVSTAFLITETVVLSGVLSLIKDLQQGLVFLFSLFGFIISIAWWTTFQYNHSFYLLRINEAKKFEPKKAGFFKDGEKLKDKGQIRVGKNSVWIPWPGRPPKNAITLLILLFAFSFFLLAVLYNPFFKIVLDFCRIC